MIKVINIISEIDKSLHFEWLTTQMSGKVRFVTVLIGKQNTQHEQFLRAHKLEVYVIPYDTKKDLFLAFVKLVQLFRSIKPDIVHTHFWIAHILGIPAAALAGVKIKIMTRHHAEYHHNYFAKGVAIDKLLNRMSNVIIAPTQNVKDIMGVLEGCSPDKVRVIHHGIDLTSLKHIEPARIERLKEKYGLSNAGYPVIGVISRYFELKGIQFIIPAFLKILKDYPNAHLVLANAHGDYGWKIKQLLSEVPPSSYTEIGYESDVAALYRSFDVFLHVPIDSNSESFGLVYLEALALNVPSVFTLSGIACDFISNEFNAVVVDYCNEDAIAEGIRKILTDRRLLDRIVANGQTSVQEFTMEKMASKVADVYYKEYSKCAALQE